MSHGGHSLAMEQCPHWSEAAIYSFGHVQLMFCEESQGFHQIRSLSVEVWDLHVICVAFRTALKVFSMETFACVLQRNVHYAPKSTSASKPFFMGTTQILRGAIRPNKATLDAVFGQKVIMFICFMIYKQYCPIHSTSLYLSCLTRFFIDLEEVFNEAK